MFKNVFLVAKGNVQGVMFRQTILKVAKNLGLTAGATNCYYDPERVDISLQGEENKLRLFFDKLKPGKELNSWGAKIDNFEYLENGRGPLDHQINTNNFQDFNWRQDITFYVE